MRGQGTGHIVQISTVGAVGSMPTMGLYNAAKWGLEGFSEALASEASGFGVRVTIAELGGLDTEWATASMRFSKPLAAYDELRHTLFGTAEVPWPAVGTGGGTSPDAAAAALVQWVKEPADDRLRLLVGEDAAAQVKARWMRGWPTTAATPPSMGPVADESGRMAAGRGYSDLRTSRPEPDASSRDRSRSGSGERLSHEGAYRIVGQGG